MTGRQKEEGTMSQKGEEREKERDRDRERDRERVRVDPTLSRWICQICRHPLYIAGADSFAPDPRSCPGAQGSFQGGEGVTVSGSILASSRMDQSFVVLPKQRSHIPQLPPRPRYVTSTTSHGGHHGLVERIQSPSSGSPKNNVVVGESHGGRALEESFVVVPFAVASMYKNDVSAEELHNASGLHNASLGNASFNANIKVLTRVFEIASTQTQVEQPLCLECMQNLCEELDKQAEEVLRDIAAYEACLDRLEKEQHNALSGEDFAREKLKFEEEVKKLEAEIQDVEQQNTEVLANLQELDLKFKDFHELEERFWHDCNDFQLQLRGHQEERDAVLAKIEVSQVQLELLKQTNVLNDAFHICHDGDFGTINNFRLGRLPNISVEWDETNAAWGQACLLLYTLAQYCRLNFSYGILPMGSYPRIADNKNIYELYGPVNLFWSSRYDKAMTYFLACLKEFAEFANAKDRAANFLPEKCFQLPYKIDGDKVGGATITQSFNRQDKWTKALKYTLCDLKWALFWLIGNTTNKQVAASASVPTPSRGPNAKSKVDKRKDQSTQSTETGSSTKSNSKPEEWKK